jgi:hypothetical protein
MGNSTMHGVRYREQRCGWSTWGLLSGVLGPVLMIAGVVLVAVTGALGYVPLVVGIALIAAPLSWRNRDPEGAALHFHQTRPLGIELDEKGVRLGRLQDAGTSAGQRPVRPGWQAYRTFSCDWQNVTRISVVTDPAEIRHLYLDSFGFLKRPRAEGGNAVWFRRGVMLQPGARGVLLVELVTPDAAVEQPPFREGTARVAGRAMQSAETSYWAVPTRRPEELQRILAERPG